MTDHNAEPLNHAVDTQWIVRGSYFVEEGLSVTLVQVATRNRLIPPAAVSDAFLV